MGEGRKIITSTRGRGILNQPLYAETVQNSKSAKDVKGIDALQKRPREKT